MNILDVQKTCKACRFTDGNVYMSNPPKYKCTFNGEFYDELHTCHLELVPIVRCKDCKRKKPDVFFDLYWCMGKLVEEDHFCGYGEKESEE